MHDLSFSFFSTHICSQTHSGVPGSVSDSRHLSVSGFLNAASACGFLAQGYGLADPAYTCTKSIITKVKGNVEGAEKYFNTAQGRLRQVVERCFGRLKARFQRITRIDLQYSDAALLICVCCILHNVCEYAGEDCDDEAFFIAQEAQHDLAVPDIEDAALFLRDDSVRREIIAKFEENL